MAQLALIDVPAPSTDASAVRRGVCRLASAASVAPGCRRLITDEESETSEEGTSLGPAGFSLTHHRVAPHAKRAFAPEAHPTRVTAYIVAAGAMRTLDGGRLPANSLYLAGAGERVHLRLDPSAEDSGADILALAYEPPAPFTPHASARIARAVDLRPLRSRAPVKWVPDAIGDFLSPRDLYLALGPVARGPLRFRVVGPDKLVTVFVQTPKGTGPALHVHTLTTEMFCALKGRFRITWGDRGEHETILHPLDSIVIPRGHNRAFEALDEGENWLLPMVVGTNDEREDILWLDHVFAPVQARLPRLSALASRGLIKVGRRVPQR